MQVFEDVQSKVSVVVLGQATPVEESNPQYDKLTHYIFELEDHFAEAQKQAFRLVKRHKEMGKSLLDFGKLVMLLGACEENSLGKAFSEPGSKAKVLSLKLLEEAHNLLMNFEESLKDYVRVVQSIKVTMADRANAFTQQCELAETTQLQEINLDTLMLVQIFLPCKGDEHILLDRLARNCKLYPTQIVLHLSNSAEYRLRTRAFAYRQLDSSEYHIWSSIVATA
ncbi:sorting nexin 1-like [Aristolochia californica]|uniref:sorting nexin 1-like n=1 Tax=Aristolochia californica TaxID=171875 RepID=UPI0035DD5E6E